MARTHRQVDGYFMMDFNLIEFLNQGLELARGAPGILGLIIFGVVALIGVAMAVISEEQKKSAAQAAREAQRKSEQEKLNDKGDVFKKDTSAEDIDKIIGGG